jgi:hypothetical protein
MAPVPPEPTMTLVDDGRVDRHDEAGARVMNRQQRREFFERLCALRDGYARRGAADTTSVISIEEAVGRASRRLEWSPAPLVIVPGDGAAPA